MTLENRISAIEKKLGFEFVSDPRLARFLIPQTPPEYLAKHPDRPYPHPSMVITPEMARDVLKHRVIRTDRMPRGIRHDEMTGNRRFLLLTLDGAKGKKGLVGTIENGDWDPRISTPVVFTGDGFLLDGQHRFAACALSGIPIELPVTTNGQWGTFSVLDTGRGRSAGQLLGDIPYPDQAAAAARWILPVLRGTEKTQWSVPDASNQDIYDLVHGWPWFHETWDNGSWMRHISQASGRRIPLSALAASTMMALAAGASASHVQEFLNALKSSYSEGFPKFGIKGDDPRFMLRRQYLNKTGAAKPTERDRRDQASHVRKAMSIWLDHRAGIRTVEQAKLQAAFEGADLPGVWHADAVRSFHNERVI